MKKLFCYLTLLLTPQAYSGEWVQWWDVNVTALYGDDYDVSPSDEQTTFTFETAGGWKYGDWFTFQDFIFYNGNNGGKDESTYGEISARFSANKIFGSDIKLGPINDVLLALTYEEGEGSVETMLYGVGVDINIPYFTYFQLNTYYRDPSSSNNISDGWQLTPAFRMDIPVGSSKMIVDGFIDWVFVANDSNYEENFHFNPQLKYDLGAVLLGENKTDKLLIGIEYDYWKNKYGIDGIDQSTYSIIAQYHF